MAAAAEEAARRASVIALAAAGADAAMDVGPDERASSTRAGAELDAVAVMGAAAGRPAGDVINPAATGEAMAQTHAASRRVFLADDKGVDGEVVMIISTRIFRLEPEAPATHGKGDCR